tara:strand:- start:1986 stop:2486 length:501 start_codon:yes stop_codon:yes gene_type:complete
MIKMDAQRLAELKEQGDKVRRFHLIYEDKDERARAQIDAETYSGLDLLMEAEAEGVEDFVAELEGRRNLLEGIAYLFGEEYPITADNIRENVGDNDIYDGVRSTCGGLPREKGKDWYGANAIRRDLSRLERGGYLEKNGEVYRVTHEGERLLEELDLIREGKIVFE